MASYNDITKLVLVSLLVIVAILALSYTPAYGTVSPGLNLTLPPSQQGQGSSGAAMNPNQTPYTDPVVLPIVDEITYDYDQDTPGAVPAIPEPATLLLFGAGLSGLAFYRKRR